jgi:prolyl 4-hydroxylase
MDIGVVLKCTGGETYFPDLKGIEESADGEKFSHTDRPGGMGLLVKPRQGNAVF